MMNDSAKLESAEEIRRAWNDGLERGRRAQTQNGYAPPIAIYHLDLSSKVRVAYKAGGEKGNTTVTRLDLLRR